MMAFLNILDPRSDSYAKAAELRHRKTAGHMAAGKPLKINQDGQDKTLGDPEDRSPDRMKTSYREKTWSWPRGGSKPRQVREWTKKPHAEGQESVR